MRKIVRVKHGEDILVSDLSNSIELDVSEKKIFLSTLQASKLSEELKQSVLRVEVRKDTKL